MPLFYTPFFYHSLEKEPRKSGFLLPLMGHSSRRGWMVHAGYFWAINRSYDLTYRAQYYTTRGLVHHVDFRGKPRPGTDYDVIMTGVQDKGVPRLRQSAAEVQRRQPAGGGPERSRQGLDGARQYQLHHQSSASARNGANPTATSSARKFIPSASSTRTGPRSPSTRSSRACRISSLPKSIPPPAIKPPNYVANAVTIRKLPEVEFTSRAPPDLCPLPFYFSFESSAGLLFRSEPVFNSANTASAGQISRPASS